MALTHTVQDIEATPKTNAHIYRQIVVTFALGLLSFTGGITFGFTAVLLPQLKQDHQFPYDKSIDSWIASIAPLAMIIGCLCSGTMIDMFGRKMGQVALIIPYNIGWIIIGLSTNNVMIFTGRFITGICTGSTRPNSLVYIGEFADPKYRAIALFVPTVAVHLGCLFSHIVGKYVYWKTACFIFTIPNFISLLILMFSNESPLWLLSKGRVDEGIKSFRLFRGENCEKELQDVLKKCKEESEKESFRDIVNILFSKPFMKSVATIFFLFLAVQLSGINSISFYAQDIFEKTFSGEVNAFQLMLATDCIRALAGVIMCFLAKKIPRKLSFIVCCFSTSLLLFAEVVYLCLRPEGFIWIGVVCMIAYIIIASAIVCIAFSFVAEIFPMKVRGFGSGLTTAISFSLLFISVKVIPQIINEFGAPALYGSFAVMTLIAGVSLIFMLPETNGKSLQEIEDSLYVKKLHVQSVNNNNEV